MAPPFIALTLAEFAELLDEWHGQHRRAIDAVHLHYGRPGHADYRGHETIVGIWREHTATNGWSDIAQHLVIAPDGTIWTGRHFDRAPISAAGHNGNARTGPLAIALIGDFDGGRDAFDGPQRDTAWWVAAMVLARFGRGAGDARLARELAAMPPGPGGLAPADLTAGVAERLEKPRPAAVRPKNPPGSYDALAEARRWLLAGRSPAEDNADAEPAPATGVAAAARALRADARARGVPERPLDAAALALLRPHVINLTAGELSSDGRMTTSPDDLERIFGDALPRHIAAAKAAGRVARVVLFAHGGLVDEDKGLRIALNQVDWWTRNHVYPLFFVWETGLFEELGRIIGFDGAGARAFTDLTDAAIEAIVRRPAGRLWRAMKDDAERAFRSGGAGRGIVARMTKLARAHGDDLEFHAVGHSAGSIFHSWLLPVLARTAKRRLKTIQLLAPAITVADYKARLDDLVGGGTSLAMFTMSKDFELADTVTPLYRKSLLYMILRALEPERDTPILGLDESLRADPLLRRRFGLDGPRPAGAPPSDAEVIFAKTAGTTGRSESQAASHGDFDNDGPTMDSVLRRILALPDAATLPLPFPNDGVARGIPTGAPTAFAPTRDAPAVMTTPMSGSARRALTIGIDAYPDPRARLSGCVADARAWEAALAGLGYAVETLHDAAATRAAILDRMTRLVGGARAGDSVVIQFAGHGTQLPDTDADEDDAKDEAFCPFDYLDGGFIVDDDFRRVFDAIPSGVGLTCFFDCCHSGTITRLAVGRDDPAPASRPRFLVAPEAAVAKFRARPATPRAAPASREAMRHVVFAACNPEQVALETDGRGDFSRRTVPLIAGVATLTNAALRDAITAAFGPTPRQTPNLDTAPALEAGPLLFLGGGAPLAAAPATGASAAGLAEVAVLLERAATLLRAR